jgi:hypothetical protein
VTVCYPSSGLLWELRCDASSVLEGSQSEHVAALVPVERDRHCGRILIVEDEPLLAHKMSDVLCEIGFEVLGPAHSVQQAMELLARDPSAMPPYST